MLTVFPRGLSKLQANGEASMSLPIDGSLCVLQVRCNHQHITDSSDIRGANKPQTLKSKTCDTTSTQLFMQHHK